MSSDQLPYLDMTDPGFSTRGDAVHIARRAHWCARTPHGYAILCHRQAGMILRDRRLRQGSYDWPRANGLTGSFTDFWERSLIATEGARHKDLRRIAQGALSETAIAAHIPAWRAIADDLCGVFAEGAETEFMARFATPFSGRAIAALLGVSDQNWAEFTTDAIALGLAMSVNAAEHADEINAACDRLFGFADRLIEQPAEGSYIARLIDGFNASGGSETGALRDLVVISIFGGVDTTRAQLGNAMTLFAANPDQWHLLRRAPDLIPAAIAEAIRHFPTTTWATREVIEDFRLEDQDFRRGDTLHILVHATATDPGLDGPPGFDITARRKPHFGFGGGAHHCLGQLVARTDMAAALSALAQTIQAFEVLPTARFLPDLGNTGPVELPLRCQIAG